MVKQNKSNKQQRQERIDFNIATWCSFWRHNPHRFIKDYLGVGIFIFQQILIYYMFKSEIVLLLASRGLGKSFVTALFSIAMCILYPKSSIVITSATRGQANLLVSQKIDKELRQRYPAIEREILEIKTGINETLVRFKNGSIIQVCVASENSRGYRATCIIVDESRLVKKSVLNEVIRPFLNFVRMPNFLNKKEYADKKHLYMEENKEIYLTSCGKYCPA